MDKGRENERERDMDRREELEGERRSERERRHECRGCKEWTEARFEAVMQSIKGAPDCVLN